MRSTVKEFVYRHITQMGFQPMTVVIFRAVSYQLDNPDCPVARDSVNPMFEHVYSNDL